VYKSMAPCQSLLSAKAAARATNCSNCRCCSAAIRRNLSSVLIAASISALRIPASALLGSSARAEPTALRAASRSLASFAVRASAIKPSVFFLSTASSFHRSSADSAFAAYRLRGYSVTTRSASVMAASYWDRPASCSASDQAARGSRPALPTAVPSAARGTDIRPAPQQPPPPRRPPV